MTTWTAMHTEIHCALFMVSARIVWHSLHAYSQYVELHIRNEPKRCVYNSKSIK